MLHKSPTRAGLMLALSAGFPFFLVRYRYTRMFGPSITRIMRRLDNPSGSGMVLELAAYLYQPFYLDNVKCMVGGWLCLEDEAETDTSKFIWMTGFLKSFSESQPLMTGSISPFPLKLVLLGVLILCVAGLFYRNRFEHVPSDTLRNVSCVSVVSRIAELPLYRCRSVMEGCCAAEY
ncbi:hypothetical protein Tco_1311401 [Tanacetum coccineum]